MITFFTFPSYQMTDMRKDLADLVKALPAEEIESKEILTAASETIKSIQNRIKAENARLRAISQ